jgi:hypothetical protein
LDDHFWPSIYPGIIVALLVGLAMGGWAAIAGAVVGGLLGAVGAYFATLWLGALDSPLALCILIAGAGVGGFAGGKAANLWAARKAQSRVD